MTPITIHDLQPELEKLKAAVIDPDAAYEALSPDEQDAYIKAQQSVVDARRSAETSEGLLQVN